MSAPVLMVLALLFSSGVRLAAQTKEVASAPAQLKPLSPDTNALRTPPDSLAKSDNLRLAPNAIEHPVVYHARDSIRFEVENDMAYLYGAAQVDYEKIQLKADYIELNLKNSLVYAKGVPDSTGKLAGNPEFTDGDQTFKAKQMNYNFKTKKGRILEVATKQEQGYLLGDVIKKDSLDNLYIRTGKYTTCEQEDPHFFFLLNKVKVIKNDKIVTGPADLFIAGIPTPLALPFGFFPNKKGRSNGILLPRPFNSDGLGFGLEDLGYYMGLGDKMDLSLNADVYSRGSWRARAKTTYNVRYKYSGNLLLSTANIFQGDKGFPDYAVNRDFNISWTHQQDPKARPNSRFSASVRAGKINNIAQRNIGDYVTSTFNSNISYYQGFAGTPFSLTLAATHDQNTLTRVMNINAPTATFNMAGINPLGSRFTIGKPKWMTDLRLNYQANLRNILQTTDTGFVRDVTTRLGEKMKSGLSNQVGLGTNVRFLKYFTFNPSATYNENLYLQSISREVGRVGERDTIIETLRQGLRSARSLSLSGGITTQVFGMYQFRSGKVKAIRHQITPTVSGVFTPKLSDLPSYVWQGKTVTYSPFEKSAGGPLVSTRTAFINYGLNNLIAIKYKSKKDTLDTFTKANIFDNIGWSGNYNVLADSLRWSPLSFSARTTLLGIFNVQYSSSRSFYALDPSNGRQLATTEWERNGRHSRLTSAVLAVGITLRSKSSGATTGTSPAAQSAEAAQINANRDAYIDFNLPWSLNINYNFIQSKPGFVSTTTQTVTVNGELSLTPKWKLTASSGWDFTRKDLIIPNINIYRDLHCWDMRINIIPYGTRKAYTLDVNVRASVLQDLKLSRKKDWYDLR